MFKNYVIRICLNFRYKFTLKKTNSSYCFINELTLRKYNFSKLLNSLLLQYY